MLLEEPEKFSIGKVSKLNVNSMVFSITSHFFPQLRLPFEFFFSVSVIQSLE